MFTPLQTEVPNINGTIDSENWVKRWRPKKSVDFIGCFKMDRINAWMINNNFFNLCDSLIT